MTKQRPLLGKTLSYETNGHHWDAARNAQNDSGRCVHSQAIMAVFGTDTRPKVDSEHIQVTDPETGDRYYYKTPHQVVASLLAFDNGIRRDEPVRVRARLVQIKRRKKYTPTAEVRRWALSVSELAPTVRSTGLLPDRIAQAYKEAHPGEYIHSQSITKVEVFSSHDAERVRVTEIAPNARGPRQGLLPGGHSRGISAKDRRTFGARSLTRSLIADGWTPPSS